PAPDKPAPDKSAPDKPAPDKPAPVRPAIGGGQPIKSSIDTADVLAAALTRLDHDSFTKLVDQLTAAINACAASINIDVTTQTWYTELMTTIRVFKNNFENIHIMVNNTSVEVNSLLYQSIQNVFKQINITVGDVI